jgi:hypothetical protein
MLVYLCRLTLPIMKASPKMGGLWRIRQAGTPSPLVSSSRFGTYFKECTTLNLDNLRGTCPRPWQLLETPKACRGPDEVGDGSGPAVRWPGDHGGDFRRVQHGHGGEVTVQLGSARLR